MKCCACHRPLTNATSLARGIGPTCAARLGIRDVEPVRINRATRQQMRALRRLTRINESLGLGYDDPAQQDLFME